jgi:two-component system response regulator HydG
MEAKVLHDDYRSDGSAEHEKPTPIGLPGTVEDLVSAAELERRYVDHVLRLVKGNKSRAARILGFDRRTLYRKLERTANAARENGAGEHSEASDAPHN